MAFAYREPVEVDGELFTHAEILDDGSIVLDPPLNLPTLDNEELVGGSIIILQAAMAAIEKLKKRKQR